MNTMLRLNPISLIIVLCSASWLAAAPATQPAETDASQRAASLGYHICAGSTHAHTSYTWSHGEQWAKGPAGEKLIEVDENGAQHPAKTQVLKPDWQKVQGPPAVHFALAKSLGYDFYITTDHSQEAAFQPPGPTNANWADTL